MSVLTLGTERRGHSRQRRWKALTSVQRRHAPGRRRFRCDRLYLRAPRGAPREPCSPTPTWRPMRDALRACWGWRDDDVLLHALPIFHVHGLFIALHCALLGGTPTIFLPRFDAEAIVRTTCRQSTVMMGVPTYYSRLLNHPGFEAPAIAPACGSVHFRFRAAHRTDIPVPWESRTGHRILERYGMSETIINTSNPLHGDRVAGTVGHALPGVQLRVVDRRGQRGVPGRGGHDRSAGRERLQRLLAHAGRDRRVNFKQMDFSFPATWASMDRRRVGSQSSAATRTSSSPGVTTSIPRRSRRRSMRLRRWRNRR